MTFKDYQISISASNLFTSGGSSRYVVDLTVYLTEKKNDSKFI